MQEDDTTLTETALYMNLLCIDHFQKMEILSFPRVKLHAFVKMGYYLT